MSRKKSSKRKSFHKKINEKERKIRRSRKGEKINLSCSEIERVMNKYNITDYEINTWEDIIVRTIFSNWKISYDDEVIFLHHENERLSRIGNYRSSYHIQNVFYDLDFCVKSIVEHELYRKNVLKEKEVVEHINIEQINNSS